MVELKKKQVKIISVLIALIFIGSVVALGVSQYSSSFGVASAASSSVGVIDYQTIFSQSTEIPAAQEQMKQAIADAEKEFQERTASMDDQSKSEYYLQTQQRLRQKQQELFEPIKKNIDDTVGKVAQAKGLSVVLDKNSVVYGGQDITQDVISKLAKK